MVGLVAQILPTQEELDRIAESLSPIDLSGVAIFVAIATFVVSLVLARLTRRAMRRLGARLDFATPANVDAVARVSSYAVVVLGLLSALAVLGIDLIPLLGGLGLLIVVAALALRPFLENFAAGISLHIERPIELGDEARVSGIEGRVEGISARTMLVSTPDGRRAYIPNRDVLSGPIINYTAEGRRRTDLDVGLAYDTDLGAAAALMNEATAATPGVLAEPPPEVFIHEFADSTIEARVRFWHAPELRSSWTVRHDVAVTIKRALDGAGIEIAFPQRVVWSANGAEEPGEVGRSDPD